MPKQQPRIEYEQAFYHVMNRGRARCVIFHEDVYYQTFLDTLGEACLRFECLVRELYYPTNPQTRERK